MHFVRWNSFSWLALVAELVANCSCLICDKLRVRRSEQKFGPSSPPLVAEVQTVTTSTYLGANELQTIRTFGKDVDEIQLVRTQKLLKQLCAKNGLPDSEDALQRRLDAVDVDEDRVPRQRNLPSSPASPARAEALPVRRPRGGGL